MAYSETHITLSKGITMSPDTSRKIILASRIAVVTVLATSVAASVYSEVALRKLQNDGVKMSKKIKDDLAEPIVFTATPHRTH